MSLKFVQVIVERALRVYSDRLLIRRRSSLSLRENFHTLADDLQALLGKPADRLGIGDAFLFKDAGGECFDRIIRQYRTGPLKNNRAMVVLIVGKMHRAAGNGFAGGEHRLMYAPAVHSVPAEFR